MSEAVLRRGLGAQARPILTRHPEPRNAPPPLPEIARLYYAIEALRTPDRPMVVQFVAANPGEGTTTLARGFADMAAAERSRSVLLVECGSARDADSPAPSLVDAFEAGLPLMLASSPVAGSPNLRRASLSARKLPGLPAERLGQLVEALRRDHAVTVLDSPAATTAPEAIAISRFCDGSVLVVRAEATRGDAVEALRTGVERMGGQVIGAVLNRRRRTPRWLGG